MTTTTNFLGIPVEGDVQPGAHRVPQKTQSEFAALLTPVLNDPLVDAIRWTQYTPYFNDGDTCIFSCNRPTFKLTGLPDNAGEEEDGFVDLDFDPEAVQLVGAAVYDRSTRTRNHNGKGDAALYKLLQNFGDEIERGYYDDVLMEAFGDHARVTVTTAKIEVDTYEHD